MSITEKILCSKSHEFLLDNGDNTFTIGLTDYAVEQLGDIVFLELPETGAEFKKGETFATVESVKAASEIYMPVSGKIIEINEEAANSPEILNEDSYEKGWLVKVEATGDTAAEREKAGTGGRSGQAGEAGNGAEPSGSEAGTVGQTGTEAGAAGSAGADQSGTEAGAAGSTGAGQSGTEAGAAGQAGAEAGAAGDAASGQTGISGQSGTEAGAAGQAGVDANAAGSAASGQTGTKLGTDKVAAAISSHDAERTKEALNSSWLPVYDAASGEYKLYNAGELLSSNGGVVLSAEEKMEALSRQGINVNYGQVNAGAHHTDSDKRGFKILGGIAAAILLILGSFWLRRRNAK